MATANGIIFSNIHDKSLPELTRKRTMASIPFGCKYRLIDFALSNMVNSGITNVSVITHYNYQSLIDHIGSGKDWDLARRSGGIKILTPYITSFANATNALYNSRLEALMSINYSLSRFTSDVIVFSDCDVICNIDLNDMINDHIKNDADITFAVKSVELTEAEAAKNLILHSDESGRIDDAISFPSHGVSGKHDINLNIFVANRKYIQGIVNDAIAHGYKSFNRDIIAPNLKKNNFRAYKYDGYFANITSMQSFFTHNMELITNPEVRDALFGVKNRPVYTKVRNSAPAKYGENSSVKNSLIADGCVIEGTVENSILFRGVKIGRNTTVKNSILFQDTVTGENVILNCVITDKNVVIRDDRMLSGHESLPFFIEKGKMI
jgi:glucose-1-phosphate adenylyltransferase